MLDQAYLKLSPLNWVTVSGGRFPNPFFVGTVGNIYTGTVGKAPHTIPTAGVVHTDLLWDVDLNFEGLALNLLPWAKENRIIKPFFNAGIFPLQQINQSETVKAKDKWFYGAQAGLEWAPESTDTKIRIGASFYDFRNISGVRNPAFEIRYLIRARLYSGKKAIVFLTLITTATLPQTSGRWQRIIVSLI